MLLFAFREPRAAEPDAVEVLQPSQGGLRQAAQKRRRRPDGRQRPHGFVGLRFPALRAVQKQDVRVARLKIFPGEEGMGLIENHRVIPSAPAPRGYFPAKRARQFEKIVEIAVPDPAPQIRVSELVHLVAQLPHGLIGPVDRTGGSGVGIARVIGSDQKAHGYPGLRNRNSLSHARTHSGSTARASRT